MSRISDLAGFTTALSTTQDLSVGVITATSFSGDGSGLTGVASTDNIQTATDAKFLANVNITGITTATGGFVGDLTGDVTGNTSGTAGGLTGTPNITVGSVTAASGSFSGNVTIGGTLTYQDVTNIDSIGIITAQQGIQVLANGVDVTGIGTFEDRLTYDGSLGQAGGGTVTYTVTVASKDSTHRYNGQGSGNAYIIDNLQAPVLTLTPGRTYRFTNDNTGSHPLKFYYDANKTTLYTTGVTFDNAYTEITVSDTTPAVLHYQCTAHSLMGNSVITQSNPIVGAGITLNGNGGGVHVTGIVTATSFSGDGSSLTGVGPQFTGIASGSIADGKPVVITDDGKVMAISGETASTVIGDLAVVETEGINSSNGHGTNYDPVNDKVVIAYTNTDNSDRVDYRMGTVGAGRTITWTSRDTVTTIGWNPRLIYDTNSNKMVVGYRDSGNSNYGTARVGTIASGGGSISWGSATVFESGYTNSLRGCFDSTNNKVVFCYRDSGNSHYGTAVVGTVSGTSISFGTPVVFESAAIEYPAIAFDESNGKVLITYQDQGESNAGKAVVGTVSGTSISFGTVTEFSPQIGYNMLVYFAAEAKLMMVYSANTSTIARFATISGTSVTFESEETVANGSPNYVNTPIYHSVAEKVMVSYSSSGHIHYRMAYHTGLGGSNIDFDSATVDTAKGQSYETFGVYDPDTKQIVTTYVDSDIADLAAFVSTVEYSNTNLSASNFIGISNAAYSNGDTATVQVPGAVDDAQTGLTTGAKIYADPTGILSTSAGDPSVVAGRAVSATKLLISFA